jgi:hypothetical protein
VKSSSITLTESDRIDRHSLFIDTLLKNLPISTRKFILGGVFFGVRKRGAKPPYSPHKTPQIHHQKTSHCTPHFPKHPSKMPIKHKKVLSATLNFFAEKNASYRVKRM